MQRRQILLAGLVATLSPMALLGCEQQEIVDAVVYLPTQASTARPSPDGHSLTKDAKNTTALQQKAAAHCAAGMRGNDPRDLGGFGSSNNLPMRITQDYATKTGACYLLAEPDVVISVQNTRHMRLTLVNATDKTLAFAASDGRLNIIQQAQDAGGNWKPIEYLPPSFCGNSYHHLHLSADAFWSFPVPRYDGPTATKLRFVLIDGQGQVLLASNEFDGSIDPKQFDTIPAENPFRLQTAEDPTVTE